MKKKLVIAMLLAGVMAATCFAGCTGNDNGEGEKGEHEQEQQQGTFEKGVEVTAEEWVAAMNASMNSTNFSMSAFIRSKKTITGNYMGNDKVPINLVDEFTADYYQYIDLNNNNSAGNGSNKYLSSGFADIDIFSHFEDGTGDWWMSLEDLLSSYGMWDVEDKEVSETVSSYGLKIDGKSYSANKYGESEWGVNEADFSGVTLNSTLLMLFAVIGYDPPSLVELYDVFTYSDGVYAADFLAYGVMFTWSVSFKDGYVLSLEIKHAESDVEEKDGLTVASTSEYTEKYYNIGKTTVKPTPEALKAVEYYIKENS